MQTSFRYSFCGLPNRPDILCNLDSACRHLAEKLSVLKVEDLPISDYNKKYFGRYLQALRPTLQLYSFLLAWSLSRSEKPLTKIVLIDYGGGSGFLSLLAKTAGVGRVVYCDIYDVSCKDAHVIADYLGLPADAYLQGDARTVKDFLEAKGWHCDALTSMNVIEHIYDVPQFLREIASLPGSKTELVLASAANPLNPRTNLLTMRLQQRVELEDRCATWGHKPRDTIRAFRSLRRQMINERFPDISPSIVEELASRTRGKMLQDIFAVVEKWQREGVMPPSPAHPTNTCDPITGNFAEQLMNPYELGQFLRPHGFAIEVFGGYYPAYKRIMKGVLTSALNLAIRTFPRQAIKIAPYYVIHAYRTPANS